MTIEVEHGHAIPPETRRIRRAKYPYADMDIDTSFLVLHETGVEEAVTVRRMYQSVVWANARYAPAKFTARVVEEGVRVWRIE